MNPNFGTTWVKNCRIHFEVGNGFYAVIINTVVYRGNSSVFAEIFCHGSWNERNERKWTKLWNVWKRSGSISIATTSVPEQFVSSGFVRNATLTGTWFQFRLKVYGFCNHELLDQFWGRKWIWNEFESIMWCRGVLVVDLQKICVMVHEMNKNEHFPGIPWIVLKSRDRLLYLHTIIHVPEQFEESPGFCCRLRPKVQSAFYIRNGF